MNDDLYRATAGTFDLMAQGYAEAQRVAVDELLSVVDVEHGPLLDVGCGSGRHLEHVLEALPAAHLIGLEPNDSMRSLALGRFAARPHWSDRVTVRPQGALEAPIPERLSGVIMLGVFGHFTRFERGELIARLVRRLPSGGGGILLDLQLPEEPTEVPPYVFAEAQLGSLSYRGIAEARALKGEAMHWRMTYQTLDGDAVLEEHVGESIFHHPRHELIAAEMQAHGLALTRLPDTTFWLALPDN